jgi:hypothetical protein
MCWGGAKPCAEEEPANGGSVEVEDWGKPVKNPGKARPPSMTWEPWYFLFLRRGVPQNKAYREAHNTVLVATYLGIDSLMYVDWGCAGFEPRLGCDPVRRQVFCSFVVTFI